MAEGIPREERLQELSRKSRDILAQCGNCAQTSFFVLQDEFDLAGQDILKALTPFPGLALRGETCGAVTGCMMAAWFSLRARPAGRLARVYRFS